VLSVNRSSEQLMESKLPLLGGTLVMSEQNHAVDSSVHYNIPELQSTPGRSKPHPQPHPLSSQPNGQHCPPQPSHQEISAEESDEEDEEDDTEDDEPSTSRWQGIEAIFEAYQEYTEGK